MTDRIKLDQLANGLGLYWHESHASEILEVRGRRKRVRVVTYHHPDSGEDWVTVYFGKKTGKARWVQPHEAGQQWAHICREDFHRPESGIAREIIGQYAAAYGATAG